MDLTGPEKAVLMLLSLDEATATPILAELEADDVRKLREVASLMRDVPAQALDEVYAEFVKRTREAVAVPRGGVRYLNRLARRALGEGKMQEILEVPQSATDKLNNADPQSLAGVLENEHPQLSAAVLSQLDPDQAAATLSRLPQELSVAVLERMGRMTEVPAGLVEEVAAALNSELPSGDAEAVVSVNGVARTAQLVRRMSREISEALLESMGEEHGELVAEIRQRMYGFDDLAVLDARAMRSLLEAVPVERLTVALKTASEVLREKIFSSLSRRAAERLKEDIDALGGVKLADVEAAQREIVEAALRLEAEGVLSLTDGGDALV